MRGPWRKEVEERTPASISLVRLTVEEHSDATKRYRHIKEARGGKTRRCDAPCPDTPRACTRERGHHGPHVAHGRLKRILAVWDSGAIEERPAQIQRRTPSVRAHHLAGPPSAGLPTILFKRVIRLLSSWDEIAFIVLFVIMVKFAIDVLMTLR